MSVHTTDLSFRYAASMQYFGRGELGGRIPVGGEEPDGRFRRVNVPSIGRVVALERNSGHLVRGVRSSADGSWRIHNLNEDLIYTVLGFDDLGGLNAAIQDWVKPHVPEP